MKKKNLENLPRRPFLSTRARAVWTRPRNKMGHVSVWNMYMSVKKDILLCVITRNTTKSPDKDLVVGVKDDQRDCRFDHDEEHDGLGRT